MEVSGQVEKKEQVSGYQVLYLRDVIVTYQNQQIRESRVILYEKSGQRFCLGNRVRAQGELAFFEEERNPGGFSQRQYYHCRGIGACIWSDRAECTEASVFRLRESLDGLRNRWKRMFLRLTGEKDGGILSAMLLGDKRDMDAEIKELYQVNGIAHILAISGLHLSFIGLGFYRLIRRLSGSYLFGGITGMAFLLLYILMIGNSVSAVRAVIMFVIRVAADMTGRVYDGATSLAVAAVCVICWRPLSFYDVGFQLSFGAVAGMILVRPVLAESLRGKGKSGGGLGESLLASLCVQLVTLPPVLFHFYRWPLYSVPLNLAVIPLMSLLLTLGFAGSLLYLVWQGGGRLLLLGCRCILRFYELLCRAAVRLPGRQIALGQPELSGIALYYLCLVSAVCVLALKNRKRREAESLTEHGGKRSRRRRRKPEQSCEKGNGKANERGGGRTGALILTAAGMLALLLSCPAVNTRGLEVTFLDVGQGDGIFLRERGGLTCLIDGGSSDVSGVGKYRIEPFLKARGVRRVDYIFVTHGDADHINGLEELIRRQDMGVTIGCMVFPPRELWDETLAGLCELAGSCQVKTLEMEPGQTLGGKELVLTCLGPDPGRLTESGNAASLILDASYGELDLLFTGDVEGKGEELLTERLEKRYDIVKVAHHGSKNSTGEAFLRRAAPELAVISAGRDNRYGHPHAETLNRLREQGAGILNTAESGAIILKQTGKEVANLRIIQYNSGYEKSE